MSETATQDSAADGSAEDQGVESLTTAPRDYEPVPGARDSSDSGGNSGNGNGGGASGDGTVTLPRLGALGMARWAWRQLTSMRIALILLFMLSLAAIPGSLLPQRSASLDVTKVVDFLNRHRTIGPVLDRFQFFEVYKSAWFSAIYLMLFISLIGCIIPRTWAHAKVLRKPPPAAPRNLGRMPAFESWRDETSNPAAVTARLDAAEKALKAKRFRVIRGEDASGGGWISGEKGYLREVGNLLFHLALVGILAGFAIKGYFGYKGIVVVNEGDSFTNMPVYYNNKDFGGGVDASKLPPFNIRLDQFKAQYDANPADSDFGQPRSFEADVTYTPAGSSTPKKASIIPNNPLSVDGANIYLTSHGYAPHITVKNSVGVGVYSGAVQFFDIGANNLETGTVKVEQGIKDSDGDKKQLGISGVFMPSAPMSMTNGPQSVFPAELNPVLIINVNAGILGRTPSVFQLGDTSQAPQLILDPKNGRSAVALTPGSTVQLPNGLGSITFDSVEQYAQFDINHDPSKQLVLPSAIAIVLGLTLSLGIRRRRIFVRVRPVSGGEGGGERIVAVEVAGLARAEDARLRDEVHGVGTALRARQKQQKPVSVKNTESGAAL